MLDHAESKFRCVDRCDLVGGGPRWENYIYSFEPPSGTGHTYYDSTLKKYLP